MPSYVVVGASRGLGLEFVKQLLAKGNVVIALARKPASSEGLVAIQDKNLHVVQADIVDSESLKKAASETAQITGGSLDVLINNAAYVSYSFHTIADPPSESALLDDLNKGWNTNVLGPILTTNAFLPLLRKGSLKKILTLSSGLGDPALVLESGFAGQVGYCVSKAAVEMVNVQYANALKHEGFTFLAISPGVVKTAQTAPPAEFLPYIQKQGEQFASVYPHWKGPIEPPESVGSMLGVFDNTTVADSGKFVSHLGNRNWL
ncbi:uncharacterized protein FIBRA_02823 [Fibroporia radiculosa]|uniref:NAD(P)-binding protein n=1 Tax=Fibroporia radiculosa TaxID=599839 RepID=J4I997_9APHY|nr:uncharacterized protein FIBRA_02823 [Fibroporia radiculosa]CCM00781.1 predicted protein [Fibroporia radiculosa]